MTEVNHDLVSVIIPCYNYAHFLHRAIESVLHQTYSPLEIIVVDDGSSDNTADVVARYPGVQYLWQPNLGVSAARNNGMRQSKGEYLVFLDADDELMPGAAELGVRCMHTNPEYGFVFGYCQLITREGAPIMTEFPAQSVSDEHYVGLLRRNYIWCPGAVTYRRKALELVGAFNTSLFSCEDFELNLRIARNYPARCHGGITVRYRLHETNKSRNPDRMLQSVLTVIRSQYSYVKRDKELYQAYKEGLRFRQAYNGRKVILKAYSLMRRRRTRKEALRAWLVLMKWYPRGFVTLTMRYLYALLNVVRRKMLARYPPRRNTGERSRQRLKHRRSNA
jgi:glycosyltransferase involved in cell wall biosynthesis